jgi:hypothetical protein
MVLVGKPEAKRPLGRPRHRWANNIKMDRREIGWSGMQWTDQVFLNMVKNLQVPLNVGKFLSS